MNEGSSEDETVAGREGYEEKSENIFDLRWEIGQREANTSVIRKSEVS